MLLKLISCFLITYKRRCFRIDKKLAIIAKDSKWDIKEINWLNDYQQWLIRLLWMDIFVLKKIMTQWTMDPVAYNSLLMPLAFWYYLLISHFFPTAFLIMDPNRNDWVNPRVGQYRIHQNKFFAFLFWDSTYFQGIWI